MEHNPESHIDRFYKKMPDPNLCIDIFEKQERWSAAGFRPHWHEHMQIYYLLEGRAYAECGSKNFEAEAGDVIFINSCEMHYVESLTDKLKYYVLRIDPSFLSNPQTDICQMKYIAPLSQNLLCFNNLIEKDRQLTDCLENIIYEYNTKQTGYELAVKAGIFYLIVILLRNHLQRTYTEEEYKLKLKQLDSIKPVISFIEENYTEDFTANKLAALANLSVSHFCRTFKLLTGKTSTEYINIVRLDHAAALLNSENCSITEAALNCGFSDINYFSRMFKRHFNMSPTEYRGRLTTF